MTTIEFKIGDLIYANVSYYRSINCFDSVALLRHYYETSLAYSFAFENERRVEAFNEMQVIESTIKERIYSEEIALILDIQDRYMEVLFREKTWFVENYAELYWCLFTSESNLGGNEGNARKL
jgi:hypothetical protein